jgi:acetyl-CoA acetyltransferase family protein
MAGHGMPWDGERIQEKYPGVMFSQFDGAEMVAKKFNISREEMDDFAYLSHKRAHEATQAGRFKAEIVPVQCKDKNGATVVFDKDEGIRWPADRAKLGALKLLAEGGRISAATASQISDGASAMLICNENGLKKLGLKPRARVVAMSVAGDDPVMMLSAPIPATKKVLAKAGLSIDDIDLYEVNEAFASVPLAWRKEVGAKLEKLNVNGGAMALGHPLGATGTKIMTTLLYELERRNGTYGLQAICEGGGTANATIIQRIPASKL